MMISTPVQIDSNRCTNGEIVTRWECPGCFREHRCEVTECVDCGQMLSCTLEQIDGRITAVCKLILPAHFLDDE